MEQKLYEILELYKTDEVDVYVEFLGARPCGSEALPQARMDDLIGRQRKLIEHYTRQKAYIHEGSTDANIPLSLGIPAVTLGTVAGDGAHTYDEWIESESLIAGQQLALATVLQYCI